ncbi:MAG: pilin [Candidatus Pacebacteria bacterium]|nr:pilin [Candidatus Paceibacterota bacterium]
MQKYNSKFKSFLIVSLLTVLLTSPLVGLAAQPTLQQTYPSANNTELSAGTSASDSIPQLVKYIFNLIVWLCILAAVLTLIIGGVQYLTASGQVTKMAGAKTRIYGSLLGLAILVGAWFVLHTMNPSLVIPKITYVPIKQGIVFFTENGYDDFMKATDPGIINDLVQANKAKFINYSIPDLTSEFGPLIFSACPAKGKITNTGDNFPKVEINNNTGNKLNFADFVPYAFALWGKRAMGATLTFYKDTNYQTMSNFSYHFDYEGMKDKDGNIVPGAGGTSGVTIQHKFDALVFTGGSIALLQRDSLGEVKYLKASNYFTANKDINNLSKNEGIEVSNCRVARDNPGTNEYYFNLMANKDFRSASESYAQGAIDHPPLSVKITWTTPGVYLYAQNGDERYFDSSVKDFRSIDFNQKAQDIKIINDIPERTYTDEDGNVQKIPPETHDFLAILHAGDNFSGKLKVYFEQRMYAGKGAVMSKKTKTILPAYTVCGTPINDTLFNKGTVKGASLLTINESILADTSVNLSTLLFQNVINKLYYWAHYNFGELPMIKFQTDGTIDASQVVAKQESILGITNTTFSALPYEVKEGARYGDLDKVPKSIEVFELSDRPNDCQEVQLCTEKSGRGYCLAYTGDTSKENEPGVVYYPMPWYLPVPLPFDQDDFYWKPDFWNSYCKDSILPEFTTDSGTKKSISFANNIKSIVIKPEGKCAVVLMGGLRDSVWWEALRLNTHATSRDEVFTSSDYNLEDNEIGQCGSTVGLGRWLSQSCAIAIAVYPIK